MNNAEINWFSFGDWTLSWQKGMNIERFNIKKPSKIVRLSHALGAVISSCRRVRSNVYYVPLY